MAGVHPSVVSRVLNNDERLHIKEETRTRIFESVKKLNYRPNSAARSLKMNQSNMIGMAIPDFRNPVYSSIIHGAEDEAMAKGYHLLVYSMKQKAPLSASLLKERIDGLLIATSDFHDDEIARVANTDKPFVLVNRLIEQSQQYVVLEDYLGGEMATRHLIDLNHEHIAHIAGPLNTGTALQRYDGYKQTIKAAGISFRSHYVQESDYTMEGGYEAMGKLLSLRTPPSAVFASNIMVAMGAMKAIREHGMDVPGDISVIGIHDVFFASGLSPTLTTVKMPLYEMGVEAVKELIKAIQDKNYKMGGITIPGATLIKRESTSECP
ncbi:ribose operon repressor [Geomicrobium sp. JCM 19037]|nr:ribose operon repressor [Geomicrobium sp. JCM 19037]